MSEMKNHAEEQVRRAAEAFQQSHPVEVVFSPTCHVIRDARGGVSIHIDWDNSLVGEVFHWGGDFDDRSPAAHAAEELLSAWLNANARFTEAHTIIPGRG